MSGIRDTATITLQANGTQAKQMLSILQDRAKAAAEEVARLQKAMASPAEIEKAKKNLRDCKQLLDNMQSAANGVDRAMKNLETATPKELRKTLKELNREFNNTQQGTEQYHKLAEQIRVVKDRLAEVKEELNGQKSIWQKGFSFVKDWQTMIVNFASGFGSFKDSLEGYVDEYASMQQEMANVRKFTGMTEEQVDQLNEEFKKMDTRTSREELNRLAQEAGRLGKQSSEDVLGFVRAADKINVALDDLGAGATLTLSKLTGIFGDEARYGTEESLLKVGSVINELSQNCSASAPYLAEFASRMGGVGAQAGMTIQQIMGFGAVLDTNGQKVEAAATALSQVIVRLYKDPEKYAKVAGLNVKEFAKLVREDANAALIQLLETLQSAGGMDVLSPMFADMGETGSRAIQTLATLAQNIDAVKSQQEAANVAFAEGVSVTNEAAIQNGTAEATLEKLKQDVAELRIELGKKLYPIIIYIYKSTLALAEATKTTISFVVKHRAAIISLAAAIAGYKIAVNASLLIEKAHNAIKAIKIALDKAETLAVSKLSVVTDGLRLVYYKLTGQTAKAMVAQKAFSAAMSATPWGAILTAISAAIVAFKLFDNQVEDSTKKEDALSQAKVDATVKLKEEQWQLEENIKKIKNFNGTKEQEKTLINQLNSKYGPILGTYKTLEEWYRTLITRGNEYCTTLQQQVIMEGKLEQARQLIAKAAQARVDGQTYNYKNGDILGEWLSHNIDEARYGILGLGADFWSWDDIVQKQAKEHFEQKEQEAVEYEKRAEQLRREAAEDAKKIAAEAPQVEIDNSVLPSGDGGPSAPYVSQKQIEKDAKKRALAEKQALAKAKKEYLNSMDSAKGNYEADSAGNTFSYGTGLKSYEEYLAEKDRLDLKYVQDRIDIYKSLYDGESETDKKLLLMYDEDYQKLLLKQAELLQKQSEASSKRSIEDLKKEYESVKAKMEVRMGDPDSEEYGDAAAQAEALYELKIQYLQNYRDSYKEGSKEWLAYEREIADAEQEHMLSLRKAYQQKYDAFAEQYTTRSAQKRYESEKAVVELLYKQKMITEEEYQIWLANLRKQYQQDVDAVDNNKKSAKNTISGPGGDIDIRSSSKKASDRKAELDKKLKEAKDELEKRKTEGSISDDDYQSGLSNITDAYEKELFDPVRSMLDDQTRQLFDCGEAWGSFFKKISDGGISFEDVADIAKASFAVMSSALETYSQFVEAQCEIDVANSEARYDREIELAEGNSYKTQKLEKEKEKETQKIKAEASRKEFQIKVIEAVAQTATNVLMAYAAGLEAGFPTALWLAPTLAAMAGAQGLVQVALLKKQQQAAEASGYAEGGFTKPGGKYEPAGIVHAGEWVASQELVNNPATRPMIEALDYAQRTNRIGSLSAADVSQSITAPIALARASESDNGAAIMAAAAAQSARAIDALNTRLSEPFVTVATVSGDQGINKAQEDYARLLRNKSSKLSKSKS